MIVAMGIDGFGVDIARLQTWWTAIPNYPWYGGLQTRYSRSFILVLCHDMSTVIRQPLPPFWTITQRGKASACWNIELLLDCAMGLVRDAQCEWLLNEWHEKKTRRELIGITQSYFAEVNDRGRNRAPL